MSSEVEFTTENNTQDSLIGLIIDKVKVSSGYTTGGASNYTCYIIIEDNGKLRRIHPNNVKRILRFNIPATTYIKTVDNSQKVTA